METIEVIGIGTVLLDQQMVLARFPDPDTKNPAVSHRQQVGGPVPTALVTLQRLGKQCELIGNWTRDAAGLRIEEDLTREHIRIDRAPRSAETSGFAHVWIDQSTGSRTVAYARGKNSEVALNEVSAGDFATCRILHLDGTSGDASLQAAQMVKARGGLVTLDAGSPKPGTADLIPWADVVNCPQRFGREFFETDNADESAKRLLEMGAGAVISTRGDRGGVIYEPQQRTEFNAFSIKPVDTTGAGDVFCGGLICGLLEQQPLIVAVRFAAAAAAIKCTRMGNRDALPTREEIEELMAR